MKVSVYLKSGSVITCAVKATPELEISSISGKLISYHLSEIVGPIQPMYIDPSEICAVVMDTANSARTL